MKYEVCEALKDGVQDAWKAAWAIINRVAMK
jgi:hypothetical protein